MKNLAYILFSLLLLCVTSCKEEDTIYKTAAKAAFSVGNEYEVGETVTFTDVTIPDEGTVIVTYLWEFGDEGKSTSTEQSPTFIFKKDGLFQVKLTVTDNNGLRATSQKEIKVINPTTPDFTLDKTEYQMGDVVTFIDATVTKPGVNITSYLWEFGDKDKSTSTKQNPTFAYNEAGAYPVKLTVTDSYGLKASVTKNVAVFDPSKAIAVQWLAVMDGSVTGGSSPALSFDGTAVYMLTGGDATNAGRLNAYNISDGSSKWILDVDKAMQDHHDNGSVAAGAKDIYGSPSVGRNGDIYFIVRDLKDAGADRRLFVFAVKESGIVNWAYAGKDANVYAITPAIDANSNIYVAHRSKKLWKLTSTGDWSEYTSNNLLGATGGLSVSKDGVVYGFGNGSTGLFAYNTVTDTNQWIYATDFGGAGDAFTGALRSATVTVGADGTLYSVKDLASGGGAVFALTPESVEKWVYPVAGAISDGGVVLGADGTIYANGGKALSTQPSAGVVALNADGSLKWHYGTTENAQTAPLVDDRGYIHFITADATYYVLKPDGTLFSSLKIGDSTISSPVMDDKGNLYVAVKKGGIWQMVCATSKATSYAKDSAWPMRGQNPQRTGLQK